MPTGVQTSNVTATEGLQMQFGKDTAYVKHMLSHIQGETSVFPAFTVYKAMSPRIPVSFPLFKSSLEMHLLPTLPSGHYITDQQI